MSSTTDTNSQSRTSDATVMLCPGQGAQSVGMGAAWAGRSPEAASVFDQAEAILAASVKTWCFEGPESTLTRTDVAQVAIFVTSVACYRGMEAEGVAGAMSAAAGLSLGEFTALHLAGAFSFEAGLKLVRLRGEAMQAAAEASVGGMLALIGADEAQAATICERAAEGEILRPANFNCPGQVVLSGHREAIERAEAAAKAEGLRASPLAVAGAFHSPLMQPAADRLAEALAATEWSTPTVPVMSNVTGEPHPADAEASRRLLVRQLTEPVRFESNLRRLAADHGEARWVELAPGRSLTGMMRRIDRRRAVEIADEPSSLAALAERSSA